MFRKNWTTIWAFTDSSRRNIRFTGIRTFTVTYLYTAVWLNEFVCNDIDDNDVYTHEDEIALRYCNNST